MAIDPSAIGRASDPAEIGWTNKDAMLYAVSVGVGADDAADRLQFTTENTEGVALQALPTLCVVQSGGAPFPTYGDIDKSKLLHAEQSIEWHRPFPPEGRAVVVKTIEDLLDKGSAAIAVMRSDFSTPDGAPLCTVRATAYIRDHGGFGGARGTSTPWAAPDRAPDFEFTQQTSINQALIYRLNSDRNPLHSDPKFAARGGLKAPILHGLCTFGFAAQGLIDHAPFPPDDWGSLRVRFTASVLPGEALTTRGWIDGDTVTFRTFVGDRMVLDQGTLKGRA